MIEPKITFDQYTGVLGFRSQVKELTTAERQKKKRKRRISNRMRAYNHKQSKR